MAEKSKRVRLQNLENEVKKCRICALGRHRIQACFGGGNPDAEIMFAGEAPGFDEDHTGEVFVGKAGRFLDRILKETLGLSRTDVYVANIVKCHPMKDSRDPKKKSNDRPPSEKEIYACIGYFQRQIDIIRPKVIIALGASAARALLKSKEKISILRGRKYPVRFSGGEVVVIPAFHPAYVMRGLNVRKRFLVSDLKSAGKQAV